MSKFSSKIGNCIGPWRLGAYFILFLFFILFSKVFESLCDYVIPQRHAIAKKNIISLMWCVFVYLMYAPCLSQFSKHNAIQIKFVHSYINSRWMRLTIHNRRLNTIKSYNCHDCVKQTKKGSREGRVISRAKLP